MGGIATINDVLEFIMAEATGIAIGTANFNNDQNGFPTVRSISFDFGLDIRKPPYSSLRAFYCTPHYPMRRKTLALATEI